MIGITSAPPQRAEGRLCLHAKLVDGMSDIFSEIDEELRRDRAKVLWQRYQWPIIALAVLVVAIVGGWRGYGAWRGAQADANGDRFVIATALADAGKHEDAAAAFGKIVAANPAGYATLAAFRQASEFVALGKAPEAIAIFEKIAKDSGQNQSVRDAALVRAAYLLVDSAPDQVAGMLENIAKPGNPFRHAAREAIGLAAYKKLDLKSAQTAFEALLNDSEAPASLRSRANLVLTLISGAGVDQAPVEKKQ